MLEFMNTVQRLPSWAGKSARNAAAAISGASMRRDDAKFSRNDPHPDEQASLTVMLDTTPRSSQMAFMSCPPMSKMKFASGSMAQAAVACATVSTAWQSAW